MMKPCRSIPLMVMAALAASQIRAQESFSVQAANGYVRNKDWSGLVQYATKFTASDPRSELAWYYLGNAYGVGLRDPANAVRAFERAVTLKPQWPEAWNALGFTYLDLKRYAEAASAFQRCVEQAPAKSNYWHNVAYAYAEANKLSQAISVLEKQRNAVGSSATALDWYNMGNDFAALGRLTDAISAYQKSLELNSQYGDAWNNLGVAEQERGSFDAALNAYRRAAALGNTLGQSNASNLQSGLAAAQQQAPGQHVTGQMVREFVRQGQAKAFQINHPESIAQPYGHP